jgi:hypothetical protein
LKHLRSIKEFSEEFVDKGADYNCAKVLIEEFFTLTRDEQKHFLFFISGAIGMKRTEVAQEISKVLDQVMGHERL